MLRCLCTRWQNVRSWMIVEHSARIQTSANEELSWNSSAVQRNLVLRNADWFVLKYRPTQIQPNLLFYSDISPIPASNFRKKYEIWPRFSIPRLQPLAFEPSLFRKRTIYLKSRNNGVKRWLSHVPSKFGEVLSTHLSPSVSRYFDPLKPTGKMCKFIIYQ